MFEVWQWVTLIILWFCIATNLWSIVRNIVNCRRWRREHIERMKQMEEWFDSARRVYQQRFDDLNCREIEELNEKD